MKALLKRMLRPFYRGTKKMLRPVVERLRGPLSRLLYPPEFETVFRNLEQITNNLKGYVDQSDQMLLAMFRTLHLPTARAETACTPPAVNLGNGRILTKHPAAPFLFVDANDLLETPRILLNNYQPHVTEALRRLTRPGDCCVDFGAGIGYHALTMAAAAGQSSPSFAIELDPHRACFLRDNLAATELIASCTPFTPTAGATAAESLRWLSAHAGTRVPDFVRVGSGFDVSALTADMRVWAANGSTRFLLSTKASWAAVAELRDVDFWRIESDGSLFRASLTEIEERGREQEVHFVAARSLQ